MFDAVPPPAILDVPVELGLMPPRLPRIIRLELATITSLGPSLRTEPTAMTANWNLNLAAVGATISTV